MPTFGEANVPLTVLPVPTATVAVTKTSDLNNNCSSNSTAACNTTPKTSTNCGETSSDEDGLWIDDLGDNDFDANLFSRLFDRVFVSEEQKEKQLRLHQQTATPLTEKRTLVQASDSLSEFVSVPVVQQRNTRKPESLSNVPPSSSRALVKSAKNSVKQSVKQTKHLDSSRNRVVGKTAESNVDRRILNVPAHAVLSIIGAPGKRIREIRAKTGLLFSITPGVAGHENDHRVVTISGQARDVKEVADVIESIVGKLRDI